MHRVQIKMEDEVYNTMTFKAKSLGIDNSKFVRSLIMEQNIVSADKHTDYTNVLRLLANISGNINQIAHTLNIANVQDKLGDVDYDNIINMLTVILNNTENCINDK